MTGEIDLLSDEILQSYVDGELPANRAAAIDAALALNPARARFVQQLRAQASALRALGESLLEEELPSRFLAALAPLLDDPAPPEEPLGPDTPQRRRATF